MSAGFEWYWENYRIANDWRKKFVNTSEISLSQMCQSLQNTIITPHFSGSELETFTEEETIETDSDYGNNLQSEDNIEFEMSEEMVSFLEHSMRHKMELQQKRLLEEKNEQSKVKVNNKTMKDMRKQLLKKSLKKNKKKKRGHGSKMELKTAISSLSYQKRGEEMKKLYGLASAPKISGMETALQLDFNRICDKKAPMYWPNIPF